MSSNFSEDSEEFPGRLLHQAALWDNAELLEDLLHGDQINHLNCRDAWGRTPVHAAAITESSRCLRILLQAGADINMKSGPRVDGRTALHIAAEHGGVENIRLMLTYGAGLLDQDSHGMTAVDIAEHASHSTCVDALKTAADAHEIARQEVFVDLREACCRVDIAKVKTILKNLGPDTEVINSTPNGSNTLLFKACEDGHKEIVRLLLQNGADGRIHAVTKYSPLYISSYYGRKEIVEILMKKFPNLANVCTVERWLPIHACLINGHLAILEMLLKFPYPKEILRKYRDKGDKWEYEMAFDINLRDVTGQSVLYLAAYVGNQKLVDLLLKHRVEAKKVKDDANQDAAKMESNHTRDISKETIEEEASPTRHRIAGSIHTLMTKLNLVRSDVCDPENFISPLNIDMYCNNNTETALHVAVKNKHHNIVSMLLVAGANANLRMYLPDDEMGRMAEEQYIFTGSTALVEACRNRDLGMIDLLLKNDARDDECKALFIAAQAKEELILSKLLALKAYPDPEYKINKRAFDIKPNHQFLHGSSNPQGIYTSLLPTTPVMINWHGQRCLTYLKDSWLVDAAVTQNPKLRLSPRNQLIGLYAITRLDISNNALTELPEVIFQLPSLRILTASQNKLERLPISLGHLLVDGTVTLPRKGRRHQNISPISVLEEIHLKDNRLITLPDGLFMLPTLQHLDISNNKLSFLPYRLWTAPKLRELNASLNLLHNLPLRNDDLSCDSAVIGDNSSEISDDDAVAADHLSTTSDDPKEESYSSKKSSESRSILSLGKHGSVVTCCRTKELVHHSIWCKTIQIQESYVNVTETEGELSSCLQTLNLSHNNFSTVPFGLPCLATSLTRLNLSYNRLTEMGSSNLYPYGLKQLDLSHNYIQNWPLLAHSESMESLDSGNVSASTCFSLSEASKAQRSVTPVRRPGLSLQATRSRSTSSSLAALSFCIHRRHTKLESLRTFVLADNLLTRLSMHFDEGEFAVISEADLIENPPQSTPNPKNKLRFPSLSMLDISNNRLKELPSNLHELTNLSVLNIAGNADICELPPEMGLLSRLWNLNTRGCTLHEPLKSMIESKKYKTMDVIGYLKSILEDARAYARMKMMIVGVQGIGKTSLLEQLRAEGSGTFRKKPTEHWAKRMGNKNMNTKTPRGTILSTVGVDIGDWVYEKKVRGHSTYGPVTFRTWDFGGQKEYYATHQYFLSKRSLYLVVWNICDGQKAVEEILQWLVNIQARAPNSPVLIIGTHFDLVKEKFPPSWSEELQQLIRDRFINVMDADKLGLPRVLDTIEVSCKTRHNIKLLCNLIYDIVFSLKTAGSKEKLLEQKIPASYLALEDVIGYLGMERRAHNKDPVLSIDKYHALVTNEMVSRGYKPFRDSSELNQATTFLHENGVLLHYEDVTLKDLYFLDPQWLCDMLAHVVTIREINPFVRNGIMKLEDLKHVFKSSTCAPIDAKSYIVSLLNKFEVALTWDNRTLLIPSLLPTEEQMLCSTGHDAKIPVRCRGWTRSKKYSGSCGLSAIGSAALCQNADRKRPLSQHSMDVGIVKVDDASDATEDSLAEVPTLRITHRFFPQSAVRRLLLMSYFPSGFWSRLLTRILADEAVVDIIRNYFVVPQEVASDDDLASILGSQAEWRCWQTGVELLYAHTTLFRLREVLGPINFKTRSTDCGPEKNNYQEHSTLDYKCMKFLIKIDDSWTDVDIKSSAVLEIFLPHEAVVIKRQPSDACAKDGAEFLGKGIQSVVLDPSPECVAKLLSLTVDHIDTLLEDWYPTLGTRFVHTSEGKFLVTRLVPCPACLNCHGGMEDVGNHPSARMLPDNWGSFVEMNPLYCSMTGSLLTQVLKNPMTEAVHRALEPPIRPPRAERDSPPLHRRSIESRGSGSDRDSGVGPDSTSSSRNPSVEGRPEPVPADEEDSAETQELTPVVYSFMAEECILAAYAARSVSCPLHGHQFLARIAPDVVFLDLGDKFLVSPETIKQGKLLGRGGFGFVFEGSCRMRRGDAPLDVALKMLQPVDPGQFARQSAVVAFKASKNKWERDPVQYACKAYCSARQEVNILLTLHHPHIVPLVGVCPRPLALVLELAPKGSLDLCLKHYRRSGARFGLLTLQALVLQIAKAIEYLHGQHIIYRDLKSENVLVWELPSPFSSFNSQQRLDVKLADYGISRSALPSGAKGFGGTEGFMAPEMMRHNGEEEYTEKVDCFSFGMFMYELLTLHQPYEHCDNVKEHVLEGARPCLTLRETEYPVYMLDLMVTCWSQQPRYRPSASQIVSIASAPEFTHLADIISLDHSYNIAGAINMPTTNETANYLQPLDEEQVKTDCSDIWIGRNCSQLDILTAGPWSYAAHTTIEGLQDSMTCMCQVGDYVWLGDSSGNIHCYRYEDKNWAFSYCLDPDSPAISVRDICAMVELDRVAVALSNGRLFLCQSNFMPTSPFMGEGSFILTELAGFTKEIYSMAKVLVKDLWTLWCGGSDGIISIFTFRNNGLVTNQESAPHFSTQLSPQLDHCDVTLLYSLHKDSTYSSHFPCSTWSYVHPGCTVYHWDTCSKSILNKLDCSKLVPCSESLQSISIEEHLSPLHCQVTAIAISGTELFVGTAWGCVIVADAETMRPITVFRPFEAEVRAIVPLREPANESCEPTGKSDSLMVATIGKGYRNLLARYAPVPKAFKVDQSRSIFCLLWRSHRWINS